MDISVSNCGGSIAIFKTNNTFTGIFPLIVFLLSKIRGGLLVFAASVQNLNYETTTTIHQGTMHRNNKVVAKRSNQIRSESG